MTLPGNMSEAQQYLKDRETAARVQTDFYKTSNLNPSWELRDKADDIIRGGRPVILALGWEHYVLAYGYRKKKCTPGFDDHDFKINEGWGLGHGRWTSANTWFVGQLHPAPNPNPPSSSSSSSEPTCPAGKRCCEPPRNGRCTCISNNRACP
jgi:hypothetical protein